jgi:iron complex outermembrane receptor protein
MSCALRWLVAALALAGVPASGAAQFPAELSGRVVEEESALPLEGVRVELPGGADVTTDAAGAFTLRSAESGDLIVVLTRAGYATTRARVRLESGRTTIVVLALRPAPIEMAPLEVRATRAFGEHLITRESIRTSGARTLGELVREVPGLVVRSSSGGGERVSVRGSAADAVLVVVDGAPLNDPLTGEADLSQVVLEDVASVRVLPGAQTARFGPRAQAGVIVIETRPPTRTGGSASLAMGSLGEREATLEGSLGLGVAVLEAGASALDRDGGFDYDRPASLGGGSAQLQNAAERAYRGHTGAGFNLFGGDARVRAQLLDAQRELPGPMHAPTSRARQQVRRSGLVGGWRALGARGSLRLDGHASWQTVRQQDADPPLGAAYFDTTRVRDAGLRVEAERAGGAHVAHTVAAGAELRETRIESTALEPTTVRQSIPAVFSRAALQLHESLLAPELSIAARGDLWDGDWIGTHDLTLRLRLGPLSLSGSHRSSFSPPGAADQFFRSGYAVQPNPSLEPERVRAEVELGLTAALRVGSVPLDVGVSAYRADVDGMIVWAPDFRFVWSPRNQDVKRDGGETWLRARLPRGVELSAWAALARVRYDWPGDADTAQVVYRPRHTGGATLSWQPGAWTVRFDAIHTGVREATPGGSNPLPSYWEMDAAITREWSFASLVLTTALSIDRLFDNTDTFVHGFAEPGRALRFEARVATESSSNEMADTL